MERGQLNVVRVLRSHLIQNLFEGMKLASFRVHIVLVNLNSQKTLMYPVPPVKDKNGLLESQVCTEETVLTLVTEAFRRHKVLY